MQIIQFLELLIYERHVRLSFWAPLYPGALTVLFRLLQMIFLRWLDFNPIESIPMSSIIIWCGSSTLKERTKLQHITRTVETNIRCSLPTLEDSRALKCSRLLSTSNTVQLCILCVRCNFVHYYMYQRIKRLFVWRNQVIRILNSKYPIACETYTYCCRSFLKSFFFKSSPVVMVFQTLATKDIFVCI